ncbi:tetratricopeptide repeat protein [Carboxylicivirga sp. RSCT41]|uniref:tetratricopeptide repeat protein n=1 Tax=Carboxylicivirga agarovorans TaxID=3417570 RepID=UPI003D3445D9
MKKTEFFDLVAEPALLNEESLPALNEIVEEFPWFQTGRMLLIKNLHTIEHLRFNGELKHSAAFIADRKRLFELIHNHPVPSVEEKNEVEPVQETIEEQQVEKRAESKSSSVGITTKVSSIADYFQADDVYETVDGGQIDFSVMSDDKTEKEEASSMVMPSVDFLGYESSEFVGYELKESIDPDEKKDESHSFSDWLTMLRHAPVQSEEKPVKKKSQQIIDNFLQIESPKIKPTPNKQESKAKANSAFDEDSDSNSDDLMSETLADIYIKQKHYDKAIGIYEKLGLKYPEKNAYFARRISDLEKLTN